MCLSLNRTTDEKQYKTAVSLARKYKVPLWDSYMSHLEYLFAKDDLGPVDIEKRVNSLGLLPVLLQEPEKLKEKMTSVIFEFLPGQDHLRLVYYFSLLDKCAPKEKVYHSNIALLRKLHNVAPGKCVILNFFFF